METFKYNVITAHSVAETLELVRLFPNVQALILHCGIPNFDADDLIQKVKQLTPKLPIIALTPTQRELRWADDVVQSHSPQELLNLCNGGLVIREKTTASRMGRLEANGWN